MRLDIERLREDFVAAQRGKESRHSAEDRLRPSVFQYDYLALHTLADSILELVDHAAALAPPSPLALDLGAGRSPYERLLSDRGYVVRTLDVSPDSGADYVGTVERTELPDELFDLVLCTQVLEHSDDPWAGAREIRRVLKPGGCAIVSVPHVWFYHPHPADHWRFTQEGLVHLCRSAGLPPRILLSQGGTVATVAQIFNFLAYGVFGRWGAPLYASANLTAAAADAMFQDTLFCHNFACLAQRD